MFVRARPGGCWFLSVSPWGLLVHWGSLGSFGRALGVFGFIRALSEGGSGSTKGSSGLFRFVGFIRAHA